MVKIDLPGSFASALFLTQLIRCRERHHAQLPQITIRYSSFHMTLATHSISPVGAVQARPRSRSTFLIFGAALLMRLLAMWSSITTHPHTWLFSHPWEMGLLAASLLHHQGYSSPFGVPTGPTAFIAPGYPTLIAGIFALFGIDTFASAVVIMLMHIALGLLTVWLIMHVARTVFDGRAAALAGAFWAVSPPLLFIPEIFWETSFSACSLIGAVALALRIREDPTLPRWIGFGAYCAVMTLINPALLFSLLAIFGWLAWQTRAYSWKAPALGLLTLILLFSPWPIRNAYRFHAFIPLRSTVGFELWMGNRPGANGRLNESIFPMFNKQELATYKEEGEVAYVRQKSAAAWAYIESHPAWFADMTARRIVRFWIGTGNAETSATFFVHALLTTCFGFAGLVLAWRRGQRGFVALMALPLLLFPVPYYITHAEFRYRLNIDPLLTVIAAFAATHLAGKLRAASRKARH